MANLLADPWFNLIFLLALVQFVRMLTEEF